MVEHQGYACKKQGALCYPGEGAEGFSKARMICIDSDVFLIDLRYPTDRRASETRAFLDHTAASGEGATTAFNLLEIAGVLSFNLNPQQLLELYIHFPARYHVRDQTLIKVWRARRDSNP